MGKLRPKEGQEVIQTDVPGSFCSAHDENWGGGGGVRGRKGRRNREGPGKGRRRTLFSC